MSSVVSALPTSTTNITGFLATTRGSSLVMESRSARLTIGGSKSGLGFALSAMLPPRARIAPVALENGARLHEEVLDDGAEGERREEGQRADDEDDADEQHDEERCVHRERPRRHRHDLLG